MKKILFGLFIIVQACFVFSQSLPSWITDMKLKGDFRFREEYKDETGKLERYRTRIRFRLGFTTSINDKTELGFRLASGSDPRSTNVTLGDSEANKEISIDSVYFAYKFSENTFIWGGKYKSIKYALFRPTDLLWDSDITPEGAGIVYKKDLTPNFKVFFNASYIVLDEYKSSGADPFLYFVQPGAYAKFGNWTVKGGIAFYKAVHAKGTVFEYSSGTNTLENGVLKYEYTVVNPNFEFKRKLDLGKVKFFKVFGEYALNTEADENDKGYEFGFSFGSKVKKRGDFEVKCNYRYLERDAWLDIFPDSDAFGGKTDVKGSEIVVKYGLGKNTYFVFDFYNMKLISDSSVKQKVVQFDINFRF